MASFLAQMPAWQLLDPLPILDYPDNSKDPKRPKANQDEESLESIIAGGQALSLSTE
jgi:hypothetical protein